jgi:hypothetical protein
MTSGANAERRQPLVPVVREAFDDLDIASRRPAEIG